MPRTTDATSSSRSGAHPAYTEKRAGVGVARLRRVHRVGQPALLPDLLEQPGAGSAAERGGQHGQRAAARVVPARAGHAEHQVRLLGVVGAQHQARTAVQHGRVRRAAAAPGGAAGPGRGVGERGPDQLHQPVVLDVAGRGHHHPRSRVLAPPEPVQASPGSARGPTPRSRAPDGPAGAPRRSPRRTARRADPPGRRRGSRSPRAPRCAPPRRRPGAASPSVTTSASTSTASGRSVSRTCA